MTPCSWEPYSLPRRAERQHTVTDSNFPYRPSHQSLPAGELPSQALMGCAGDGKSGKCRRAYGLIRRPSAQVPFRCGQGRPGPLTCVSETEGHNSVVKFYIEKWGEFVTGLKCQDPYRLPWCCLCAAVPC